MNDSTNAVLTDSAPLLLAALDSFEHTLRRCAASIPIGQCPGSDGASKARRRVEFRGSGARQRTDQTLRRWRKRIGGNQAALYRIAQKTRWSAAKTARFRGK